MGWIASIIAVLSLAYSVYTGLKAQAAAKKAKREAEDRADRAKGFQFVVEGSAEPAAVAFGRFLIGGTRVHSKVTDSYVAGNTGAEDDYIVDTSHSLELINRSHGAGVYYINGINNLQKTSPVNAWDTFGISEKTLKLPTLKVTLVSINKLGLFGFGNSDLGSVKAFSYCWFVGKDNKAWIMTGRTINSDGKFAYLFDNKSYAYSTQIPNFTIDISDILEIESTLTEVKFKINGAVVYSEKGVASAVHVLFGLYTPTLQFQNINITAKIPAYVTFASMAGGTSKQWALKNTATDWSGTWYIDEEILDPLLARSGSEPRAWIVKKGDIQWSSIAISKSGAPTPPKTDYIFCYYREDLLTQKPPTLESLNFSFPKGNQKNVLATSKTGKKKEYLFTQQVLSQGRLASIISVLLEDQEYTAERFSPGFQAQIHLQGGVANSWMTANDGSRIDSRFSSVAYATCCFKLNRDDPQFSGLPEAKFMGEGNLVRNTDGVNELEASYSNNPFRILLEYLRNEEWGKNLPVQMIDLASFKKAIDICERIVLTDIPPKGTFWQTKGDYKNLKLFECNLTISSSEPFRANVNKILSMMDPLVDLIWSDGKYKVQFRYPELYSTDKNYSLESLVQIEDEGKLKLFKSLRDVNVGNDVLTSPLFWEELSIPKITDDDLNLNDSVTATWPDLDNKLNYCTVRFLNEEKNFKEDTVSWPEKEHVPRNFNVKVSLTQGQYIATFSEPLTLPSGTQILHDRKVSSGIAFTITGDLANSMVANISINWATADLMKIAALNTRGYIYALSADSIYETYLTEDAGILLETDLFADGVTTEQHARAMAEQKVRLSRHTAYYKFSVGTRFFDLEPNDLVVLESPTFEIPHTLLVVNNIETSGQGKITLDCSTFDARLLAWNIRDDLLEDFELPLYYRENREVINLQFSEDTGASALSYYKLTWEEPRDYANIKEYRIKYTVQPLEDVDEDSEWIDIGSTTDLVFWLPALEGTFTFAVVAVTRDGRQSSFIDNTAGTQWSIVEGTMDVSFLKLIDVNLSDTTSFVTIDAGGTKNYGNTLVTITVTESNQELAYDGIGTDPGTWKFEYIENGITIGTIVDNGNTATIGPHSDLQGSAAYIEFNITGKYNDGRSFNSIVRQKLIAIQTGSKAIIIDLLAEIGITASELDGTGYNLPPNNQIYLYSNGVLVESGVTYGGAETKNGLTATVDSSGFITFSGNNWNTDTETFIFTATFEGTTYQSQFTYSKSKRGGLTVLPLLSSTSDIVVCDTGGAVLTFPGSNTMSLYQGGIRITNNVTFSGNTTQNGLKLEIDSSSGIINLSEDPVWTTDVEMLLITAEYGGTTYTLSYTVMKIRGLAGINAPVTLYLYQRTFSETPPSVETSEYCIYNYSSQSLTNVIPDGWQTIVPSPIFGYSLWAISVTITGYGTSVNINNDLWSTPFLISKDGLSAAYLKITNTSLIFTKDSTGDISPTTLTLNTCAENIEGPTYQWYKNGTIIYGQTSSSLIIANTEFASISSINYTCVCEGQINGQFNQTRNDTATVSLVNSAKGAPTVVVSNENTTFSAPLSGYGLVEYSQGIFNIDAYVGSLQLTLGSSGYNTFSLSGASDGIDFIITGNSITPSNMTKDSAYIDITATLRNELGASIAVITKRINYSVARVGAGMSGAPGLAVIMSNDTHILPASNLGVVSSYTGSGTLLQVYEEVTELIYDGVGTTAGTWTFSMVPDNITPGAISDMGNYASIGNHSGVSDSINSASIIYTISGRTLDNTPFNVMKNQTFAKALGGIGGYTYRLTTSAPAIKKDSGSQYLPASVDVRLLRGIGESAPVAYSGRFVIATTADGQNYIDVYTSSSNESSKNFIVPAGITNIRIRAYLAGGTVILLDEQTLSIIVDGSAGSAGLHSAQLTLYQRTLTSAPPTLSAVGSFTYNFSTSSISGQPSGWSLSTPLLGGDYVWASVALISGTVVESSFLNTLWSQPTLITISPNFFLPPSGDGYYQDGTHLGYYKDSEWKSYMDIDGHLHGCTITTDGLRAGTALIGTALIADASIDKFKLGTGSVQEAHIQDLQVGTLKIKENAITVPLVSTIITPDETDSTIWTDSSLEVMMPNFEMEDGMPVVIIANVQGKAISSYHSNSAFKVEARMLNDTTVISSVYTIATYAANYVMGQTSTAITSDYMTFLGYTTVPYNTVSKFVVQFRLTNRYGTYFKGQLPSGGLLVMAAKR